jgi:hypothetical protein
MHTTAQIPFRFELPFEVWEKAGPDPSKRRRIGGIISTDKTDRQGEVVLQRGLDFSEFLSNGWFNDNHSRETTGIVGYPELVKKVQHKGRPAHYVEGYLIEGFDRADEIWKLAQSLQRTGRRLGFSIEGAVSRREGHDGRTIAEAKVRNVAITNCFPGDVRVIGDAEHVTRRYYSGPMVEIVLATGEKLTGTPNHPVLTDRGWMPLGRLVEGRYRVGRSGIGKVSTPVISNDVEHMPSMLEEIFDLALLTGSTHWVGAVEDREFHGDGMGGYVNVVAVHRLLGARLKSAFEQEFSKDALPAADKEPALLSDESLSDHLFIRSHAPTPSLVSSDGELLTLIGGSGGVAPDLFIPSRAGYPSSFDDVVDPSSGDPITGRDRGRALSPAIGFSDICSKRIIQFSGHVFNLDCRHGWYAANGVIAQNCPVNTDTGLEVLAKSLSAMEAEADLERGLSAGAAITAPTTATPGDGFALRTESLEQDEKRRRRKRRLTKSEAVAFLQTRYPGLTLHGAERVIRFVQATRRP